MLNHSFQLANYSINKYSPNLNYLDKNCERSEFFQTLSSDVREDLRPSLSRMCQAFEALDKVEQAYSDAKAVHN